MEHEEAEKMEALKQAYAGIILNTVKASAARVMESETKARRFQQDLCFAKEEGIRMLLRLKQLLHSEIDEAAMTAKSQRRTIEELEAQLHEAEEIIIDLRIELKSVENELRKAKNSHMQPSNVQIANEEPCPENRNTTASIDSHVEDCIADNSGLRSINLRTDKDPEMYKKGCTQRIHAFEGNLLDKILPLEDVDDQPKKSKSVIKEDKIDEGTMIVGSPNSKNAGMLNNLLNDCSSVEDKPVKVIRKLRRHRKARAFSTKPRLRKSCKPSQLSSTLSNTRTYSDWVNGNPISAGASSTPSSKADSKGTIEYSNGSAKSPPAPLTKCGRKYLLSRCKTKRCSTNAITKSSAGMLEVMPTIVEDVPEGKDMIDVTTLVKHGSGAPKSVKVQNVEMVNEMVDLPSADAKPCQAIDGGAARVDNDRFLKHTFQRKRKKEPLSNSDDNTSAKINTKTRLGNKDECSREKQKSSMINESTWDSRGLVDVARQLISLSGKRWW